MISVIRDLWNQARNLLTRFSEHRGLTNAASLTYSTLLSLVPMLTVVFAVLSAFPVAEQMVQTLQDFIFRYFVPAAGQAVQTHLEGFIVRASQLSGVSFFFLIIIALLLMQNIDTALNGIWETERSRRPVQKFLVYWALISLGPLLLAVSLAMTSYLVSMPLFMEAEASLHFGNGLLIITPVVASTAAFSLMYLVIPNHRVPLRHAFAGGVVAAILFDLANRAFGFYVTSFTSYQAIYGALAVFPIFLVWIYLSWVIFLFGAEFTCCLEQCRAGPRRPEGSELETAFLILAAMRGLQRDGKQMEDDRLLELASGHPGMTEKMSRTGLILQTEKDAWTLGSDLHDLSLLDLYKKLGVPLPARVSATPGLTGFSQHVERANGEIGRIFSVSIEQLLESPDAEKMGAKRKGR